VPLRSRDQVGVDLLDVRSGQTTEGRHQAGDVGALDLLPGGQAALTLRQQLVVRGLDGPGRERAGRVVPGRVGHAVTLQ
jgi:hypothetical protein